MIYLDHHAATPLAPSVRAAMARAHESAWANPESVHQLGRAARAVREGVRAKLAQVLGAKPADIVLAGSGTEALHLAVLGFARARRVASGAHELVVGAVEHPAALGAAGLAELEGFRLQTLSPRGGEPFASAALETVLSAQTACVVLQWVNHETGNLWPVAEYARVCRERGVPLVVDACQALGKLPIDVAALGASAVVVASAKVGGPAGVAALWHARCEELSPLFGGGSQERGLRPGTPDVAALAGFGAALEELPQRLSEVPRLARLRDQLERRAVALGAAVNGAEGARVATATNLSFPGWRAEVLVAALDLEGLCVSAGAACSSGLGKPSPVISAMYPDEAWRAESALRFSLGPETREADIAEACAVLERVVARAARP